MKAIFASQSLISCILFTVLSNYSNAQSVVFAAPTAADAHMLVRDMLGQVVIDQVLTAGASVYSVGLGAAENGAYIYQISLSGSAASGKVIKINK